MRPSPVHRRAARLPEAQAWNQPHGLERDPPGHLAVAELAVAKDDRQLDDLEAGAHGAVGELDLECVSARAHAVEVDRLEHLAAEALEAAGEVANLQAEHPARVHRAPLADLAPREPPFADASSWNVTGAEREVRSSRDRSEQALEIGGVVREVTGHLEGVSGP